MKKIILLLVLVPFLSFAKFQDCVVTMNDGSTKRGFIEIPENPDDSNIKFRTEIKGSTEKISIDVIKEFEVFDKENKSIKFVAIYAAHPKALKPEQYKIDAKKIWMNVIKEGKISMYCISISPSSIISSSGLSVPGSVDGGSTSYFIKKEKENFATLVAQKLGGFSPCVGCFNQMKKTLNKIFENDCPQLSEMITKDIIKSKGYEVILDIYEQNCGK